ncbi:hypothetical protein B0H17DRAFT_1213089 [Mycena rosella]|uniref:Uncharacterized protein n=1 Tax=Mycena rosella TaxID=1033263 RepID=A0AAD7G2A4_MYCRO|nr:hypothetical protein B0H17DRAFT_1213089 [Mycena rosella]
MEAFSEEMKAETETLAALSRDKHARKLEELKYKRRKLDFAAQKENHQREREKEQHQIQLLRLQLQIEHSNGRRALGRNTQPSADAGPVSDGSFVGNAPFAPTGPAFAASAPTKPAFAGNTPSTPTEPAFGESNVATSDNSNFAFNSFDFEHFDPALLGIDENTFSHLDLKLPSNTY